jgi:hypothetical protein
LGKTKKGRGVKKTCKQTMSKTKKKKKILLAEFRKMKPETQERFEIGNKTSK